MTDQPPQAPGPPPWAPGDTNDPTLDVSAGARRAARPPTGTQPPGGSGGAGGHGKAFAIVGALGVVALLIGLAVGYFAIGGGGSSSASDTTTTTTEKHQSTTTTEKKSTTTTGPPSTTGLTLDPLSVPADYNAYRAGGGVAFAIALPDSWTAVLVDPDALSHEAKVHKDNANLVQLLDGVKSLQSQGGIFFAYDGDSGPDFENNVNVIKNSDITTLPSGVKDEIRKQLTSLATPAQDITFSNPIVGDDTALVATYQVQVSSTVTAYGAQVYLLGSNALYIITMTFGSLSERQQVAAAVFPTINVP